MTIDSLVTILGVAAVILSLWGFTTKQATDIMTDLGGRIDALDKKVDRIDDHVAVLDNRVYELGMIVGGLRNDLRADKAEPNSTPQLIVSR